MHPSACLFMLFPFSFPISDCIPFVQICQFDIFSIGTAILHVTKAEIGNFHADYIYSPFPRLRAVFMKKAAHSNRIELHIFRLSALRREPCFLADAADFGLRFLHLSSRGDLAFSRHVRCPADGKGVRSASAADTLSPMNPLYFPLMDSMAFFAQLESLSIARPTPIRSALPCSSSVSAASISVMPPVRITGRLTADFTASVRSLK